MKLYFAFFSLCAIALSPLLTAAPEPPEVPDELIVSLLSSHTPESFADAYLQAQKAGVPPQVLLEARFLFLVDQQDHKGLAKLSSELVVASPSFDPKTSRIFSLKEDWLAIVHYTQALDALEKNQPDLFKKHITQAFWLSPRQASALAPHIDQFHLDQAMRQLTLPLDLELPLLHKEGESVRLIDQDSKATLLYFWSPWSREFSETVADFKTLAAAAKSNNVKCIAVLAERSSEVEADAKNLIKEEALLDKATWCTDSADFTLSRDLRVQTAPIAVLVSKEGKILSNSHPASQQLWDALERVNPQFAKPSPAASK